MASILPYIWDALLVFQRPMAIFRVWLGVRSVVTKGRLVMGLDRFLVWIQLSIASLSYEYPSVRKGKPRGKH